MSKRNKREKGMVRRWRPDTWEGLIPDLIKEAIEVGGLVISDEERENIEAFIKWCINAGADALLEGLRVYGIDAEVRKGQVSIITSPLAVPGRVSHIRLPFSYQDRKGYQGPGKVSFIPADTDTFVLPPGSLESPN